MAWEDVANKVTFEQRPEASEGASPEIFQAEKKHPRQKRPRTECAWHIWNTVSKAGEAESRETGGSCRRQEKEHRTLRAITQWPGQEATGGGEQRGMCLT